MLLQCYEGPMSGIRLEVPDEKAVQGTVVTVDGNAPIELMAKPVKHVYTVEWATDEAMQQTGLVLRFRQTKEG